MSTSDRTLSSTWRTALFVAVPAVVAILGLVWASRTPPMICALSASPVAGDPPSCVCAPAR